MPAAASVESADQGMGRRLWFAVVGAFGVCVFAAALLVNLATVPALGGEDPAGDSPLVTCTKCKFVPPAAEVE